VAVGEFMRELLGTWGLNATFVPGPEDALDLVRAEPLRFDVVITDQSMPRVTGLTLARRLREIRADIPVILYSGHGDAVAETEISAARLCAVMRKPIDPVLLSQTLARCLAGAGH
jgi:CheY-like chemotaxis protein